MTRTQDAASLRRLLIAPLAVGSLLALAACGDDGDTAEEPAEDAQAEEQDDAAGTEDEEGDAGEALTLDEVQENDDADSCWAAIDGTVYDLTGWIDEHPGGPDRIEQICGTDATDTFEGQHGGDEGPQEQLTEFEIGDLEG